MFSVFVSQSHEPLFCFPFVFFFIQVQYRQDGFFVIKQLLTLDECQKLKQAAIRLIDDWKPEEDYSWVFPERATKEKSTGRQMIDSADKVSLFVEKGAVDPETGRIQKNEITRFLILFDKSYTNEY